jgi:hypothetical protein
MVLGQFSDICGYGSATSAEHKLDENNSKKNN